MNTQPANQTQQEPAIGVVQTSYTVGITFTSKPDEAMRTRLKAAGFQYDKGRWYRNESKSNLASTATVDQLLAA